MSAEENNIRQPQELCRAQRLARRGEYDEVRDWLLDLGSKDSRVDGGAITGSAATDQSDEWSDVDVAFGYDPNVHPEDILSDWTAAIDQRFPITHHFDLLSAESTYRVYLLAIGLEVDIGLSPSHAFGARGTAFKLSFGQSVNGLRVPDYALHQTVGFGWHHAIHAYVAIQRRQVWKAEYYISALRDRVMELTCQRYRLPALYARGIDSLPNDIRSHRALGLVRSFDAAELCRALRSVYGAYLEEVALVDPTLRCRLAQVIEASFNLSV